MSRGLEFLDEDWQDESESFERIKHKPKNLKTDEPHHNRRQEGRFRRESQQIHDMKYSK